MESLGLGFKICLKSIVLARLKLCINMKIEWLKIKKIIVKEA